MWFGYYFFEKKPASMAFTSRNAKKCHQLLRPPQMAPKLLLQYLCRQRRRTRPRIGKQKTMNRTRTLKRRTRMITTMTTLIMMAMTAVRCFSSVAVHTRIGYYTIQSQLFGKICSADTSSKGSQGPGPVGQIQPCCADGRGIRWPALCGRTQRGTKPC